jgi:Bacterial SCP ortholog
MQKNSFKKDPNIASEVRRILDLIKKTAPGNAVELRIPPYGVIQCVSGVNHRRGTPANQVEMSGEVLIQLARSPGLWPDLLKSGQIQASGQLSDLAQVFSQTFK